MTAARHARLLALLTLGLGLSAQAGCSLILNWDISGLECGDNQECRGDHTCLNNKCIANASVKEGGDCVLDVQCDQNFLCPRNKCRQPCSLDNAYQIGSCVGTDYCRAYLSTAYYYITTDSPDSAPAGQPPVARNVAVCVPGDQCTAAEACPANDGTVCTVIAGEGSRINACLPGCAPNFTTTQYQDNCGVNDINNGATYCTPVGEANYQQAVCLDSADPVAEGNPCTVATNSCNHGLACINGICARLCPAGSGASQVCPTNYTCKQYNLNAVSPQTANSDIPANLGYCTSTP